SLRQATHRSTDSVLIACTSLPGPIVLREGRVHPSRPPRSLPDGNNATRVGCVLRGSPPGLMPLKLKSSSTRYVGGSASIRWMIVPSASCTFWLKVMPLIVRPLRFTFTRWFSSNTLKPLPGHSAAGPHRAAYGTSGPERTSYVHRV